MSFLSLALATLLAASPQDDKPRTDLYGDPLPPGAIARCGTVRFRHEADVLSIAFSPDGKTLASRSDDRTIHLWETATGKELLKLEGHESCVKSVVFSPDGKKLASGSDDKTIRLWETATGKELLKLEGHEDSVSSVAFSPEGKTLASGSHDKTIRLWVTATGNELLKLEGHGGIVFSIAFSPDGKTLASGSEERTIRLWDTSTVKELLKLEGHEQEVNSVAFSPNGKTLASGSGDSTIRLWETATGKELLKLEGHKYNVLSVAYSPDGKTLASGSWDGSIRLWEAATGKELLMIVGHARAVRSVAFSPDGKTLASGSWDRTALIWDLSTRSKLVGHVLKDLWEDLKDGDGDRVHAAILALGASGPNGAAFLRERLNPPDTKGIEGFRRLIARLDDDDPEAREHAMKGLQEDGVFAESLLRKALEGNLSIEARVRIEKLLEALTRPLPIPPGEPLRRHRAIWALELIGSKEAREVLEEVAKESPSLRERREAKAALGRLEASER